MLQDTGNAEIALGDLSITNRLYRKIEPYCPLPICSYRDFAETVAYVNLRPRPLAAHDFGRARAEQGLNLERRHLNVPGMRYPRFDEVVAQGKAHRVVLVGLGDWLARQEGYDKGLCQWVEVVWSKSLGLAMDIELDSKANRRRAEEEKRRKADERAHWRNAQDQARRREAEAKRQEKAARERAEARRQAAGLRKVSCPVQSVEVFRDRLRWG